MVKNKKAGKLKEALGILLVFFAAVAVVSGVLLLSKCEKGQDPHEGSTSLSTVTDEETGIIYKECSGGYGAVVTDKLYLECQDSKDESKTLQFYEINRENPEEFIALKNGNEYLLYRAETVKAPNIREFAPVSAKLFMGTSNYPIDYFYSSEVASDNSETEDGSVYVEMIEETLKSDKTSTATGEWNEKECYVIWLCSEEYEGLFYKVDFKVDINGAEYLYDRVTDKLFKAPKELVARILGA